MNRKKCASASPVTTLEGNNIILRRKGSRKKTVYMVVSRGGIGVMKIRWVIKSTSLFYNPGALGPQSNDYKLEKQLRLCLLDFGLFLHYNNFEHNNCAGVAVW